MKNTSSGCNRPGLCVHYTDAKDKTNGNRKDEWPEYLCWICDRPDGLFGGAFCRIVSFSAAAFVLAGWKVKDSMTEPDYSKEQADIAASLKGDGEAYRRLVVQYQNLIAGQMRRFSQDPVVLEELVQDVFVEAYLSLKSFRGEAPFLHWLRRLATRTGYRYWKAQARRREREAELPEHLPELPAEPAALTQYEAEELLFHLFEKLAPDDRLVLTLFYFDDCGTNEIAEQTGWSRAAVKVRLHRARNRLKVFLKEKGVWT